MIAGPVAPWIRAADGDLVDLATGVVAIRSVPVGAGSDESEFMVYALTVSGQSFALSHKVNGTEARQLIDRLALVIGQSRPVVTVKELQLDEASFLHVLDHVKAFGEDVRLQEHP